MPYLNLKDAPIALNAIRIQSGDLGTETEAPFEMRLRVCAARAEWDAIVERLQEVFEPGKVGTELRVDLPQNWLLFFKQRESESRVLVAHPQPEEWVATAALNEAHGQRLIEGLLGLREGAEIAVDSLGPVGNVSNVELVLAHV